jgi:hypothetical protein
MGDGFRVYWICNPALSCDCNTDQYLAVVILKEELALSKQAEQMFDMDIFNLKKLSELQMCV